jgi:hypothetical protein
MNAVFPSLHQVSDKTATGKMTDAVRGNLPDNLPEWVRKKFSGISLVEREQYQSRQ